MGRPRKPVSGGRKPTRSRTNQRRKAVRKRKTKPAQTAVQNAKRPTRTKSKARKSRPAQKQKAGKAKSRRRVLIYTDGGERKIKVSLRTASVVGRYMSAVGWLINHNDPSRLSEFVGANVTDMNRKQYPLETRPNVLYRLSQSGAPSFEDVYRVVAR